MRATILARMARSDWAVKTDRAVPGGQEQIRCFTVINRLSHPASTLPTVNVIAANPGRRPRPRVPGQLRVGGGRTGWTSGGKQTGRTASH
jgi:hypothetical protein